MPNIIQTSEKQIENARAAPLLRPHSAPNIKAYSFSSTDQIAMGLKSLPLTAPKNFASNATSWESKQPSMSSEA